MPQRINRFNFIALNSINVKENLLFTSSIHSMARCISWHSLSDQTQTCRVIIKSYLHSCANLTFPTNLDLLKELSVKLTACKDKHYTVISIFHITCFLFLQTWCIPGTIIFNLMGGVIHGAYKGTIICAIVS